MLGRYISEQADFSFFGFFVFQQGPNANKFKNFCDFNVGAITNPHLSNVLALNARSGILYISDWHLIQAQIINRLQSRS